MMITSHPAAGALQRLGAFSPPVDKAALAAEAARKQALLDSAGDAAASFAANAIRDDALTMLQSWAGTSADDLGEGESLADRLIAMVIGIADESQDGEIDDDEAAVVDMALNAIADYLAEQGVSDEDIDALLNNGDAGAAARVQELLAGSGDDADLDSFVFDSESNEAVLDSVRGLLDAVYKKALVVRKGKKVRINKRVSGKVVLSAAQKVAIRKATTKARSAGARVRRMKSLKVRANTGLDK